MTGIATREYQPFVPDGASVAEFTLRAVVMGVLLGMLFGASSRYLVLKVGLTVSASIPVAVIGGLLGDFDKAVGDWSSAHNPFCAGGFADLLSLLPYAVLAVVLYRVAREKPARR